MVKIQFNTVPFCFNSCFDYRHFIKLYFSRVDSITFCIDINNIVSENNEHYFIQKENYIELLEKTNDSSGLIIEFLTEINFYLSHIWILGQQIIQSNTVKPYKRTRFAFL